MAITVAIGLLLAIGVYMGIGVIENKLAYKLYTSDEVVEKIVGDAYNKLENFIAENNVKTTDTKEISDWLKKQNYIYINIYDNFKTVFEAGLWVENGSADSSVRKELKTAEKKVNQNIDTSSNLRIDKDNFKADTKNRIVNFADGEYYVYIGYYGEERFYAIMQIVKLVLSFISFMILIMVYNGSILSRIGNLAKQVNMVSGGEYEREIETINNDELGRLATSVNNMKHAIVEHGNREKQAWDANFQLITAMSHDIRTPLTSMIGYLDIIEGGKYESQEELFRYISTCRDKAFQLKELSDSLFRYFLVFGNSQQERELELVSGGILIQQMLADHLAEVMSYGFMVDFNYQIDEDVNIKTDIVSMRRLFDNLFSNMMKYASKEKRLTISAFATDDNICLNLRNYISQESRLVDSNMIGVKTCERICHNLGGTFEVEEDETTYQTRMTFPIAEEGEGIDYGSGSE